MPINVVLQQLVLASNTWPRCADGNTILYDTEIPLIEYTLGDGIQVYDFAFEDNTVDRNQCWRQFAYKVSDEVGHPLNMTSSPIRFDAEYIQLVFDSLDSDWLGVHTFTMEIEN